MTKISKDLSEMRRQFNINCATDINNFDRNPFVQFENWFEGAKKANILEPNAFVLSTSNENNTIRSRTVLLKYYDEEGFVFFTNYSSEKANNIADNNKVSALFPWYKLELQLIIDGEAEKISKAQSMKYFLSRPRESQIGAWVSNQSTIIKSRHLLLQKAKEIKDSLSNKDVPFPEFWGGFRIKPNRFEFWQGQPNRLHNRIEYKKDKNGIWIKNLLAP